MALESRDFWSWRGRVGRAKYAGLGLFLFAIKHNLDRIVADGFGYRWTILDYWVFDEQRVLALSERRAGFYAALVLLALPFIWVGVVLTLRRLRDANLPVWLVVLFFVPFVNLVLFLVLSAFPSASSETANYRSLGLKFQRTLSAVIPNSEFGSAAMGVLLTVLLAILITLLSVYGMGEYGWGLFLGIPFFLGLNSVLIYGFHRPRSFGKCVLVSTFALLLAGAILFSIAVEGVVCLIMAAPLAIVLAFIGGLIGYFIQRRDASPALHVFSALLIVVPGFIVLEPLIAHTPPQYQVQTSVIINASRADVWKHVISFPQLPPPIEKIFQTGIAYPIRADIEGVGVGAVRHCVFSTGEFVEPIKVWDEPRLLSFDVRAQPRVMDELSPYDLRPPHLENYLVSHEGQFLLTELPDGRTLLQGTTVYEIRFWPTPYWRIWSDYIIHRIHYRVLEHIKNLAEKKPPASFKSEGF